MSEKLFFGVQMGDLSVWLKIKILWVYIKIKIWAWYWGPRIRKAFKEYGLENDAKNPTP